MSEIEEAILLVLNLSENKALADTAISLAINSKTTFGPFNQEQIDAELFNLLLVGKITRVYYDKVPAVKLT